MQFNQHHTLKTIGVLQSADLLQYQALSIAQHPIFEVPDVVLQVIFCEDVEKSDADDYGKSYSPSQMKPAAGFAKSLRKPVVVSDTSACSMSNACQGAPLRFPWEIGKSACGSSVTMAPARIFSKLSQCQLE